MRELNTQTMSVAPLVAANDVEGELLVLQEPLSFWGGLDPGTGQIVDVHHPQYGVCMRNKLLVLPGTRGSTAGPGALLETLFQGNGPLAIILSQPDVASLLSVMSAEFIGIPRISIVAIFNEALPSEQNILRTGDTGKIFDDACRLESKARG